MGIVASTYIILILAMVLADVFYTTPKHIFKALASTEIQYAIKLSLISSTITMLLSVVVAIPIGYFMARFNFRFKKIIDAIIDIPIILPPLVVGLSLLLLFQTVLGQFIESHLRVTYTVYGVVLAQFMVACAFAVRTMYVTFSQINNRQEQVALTLGGCNEKQSFFLYLITTSKKRNFNGCLSSLGKSFRRVWTYIDFCRSY